MRCYLHLLIYNVCMAIGVLLSMVEWGGYVMMSIKGMGNIYEVLLPLIHILYILIAIVFICVAGGR